MEEAKWIFDIEPLTADWLRLLPGLYWVTLLSIVDWLLSLDWRLLLARVGYRLFLIIIRWLFVYPFRWAAANVFDSN